MKESNIFCSPNFLFIYDGKKNQTATKFKNYNNLSVVFSD